MDNLLKTELAEIINAIQRADAPKLTGNELVPPSVETAEHLFDLVDSKDGAPLRPFEDGTAHYINGADGDTYELKIICYDDFVHLFIFYEENGNQNINRLPKRKMADFLVYDKNESKAYFIVNELSDETSCNKIRTARKQLSDTLNLLYKSKPIAQFIDSFANKICFLSAKDNRNVVNTGGMADGFNQIYQVLPEPLRFNFGQIGTHNFVAFETSYVELHK